MKWKYVSLMVIFSLIIFPMSKVWAFDHTDNINDGISVYFLVSLAENENIEVNVTHTGSGNFNLFLFDSRPVESFINIDNSLDPEIFNVAINYSVDDNPYINYTRTLEGSKIYYIQLVLLENGPDTLFLYCNKELTRYYLPSVPGYDLGILTIAFMLVVPIILILIKRKIKD